MLTELFKKHSQWVNYIKSFGCPDDVAEDYVQEMYIKMHYHIEKHGNTLMFNNNEINRYFIYVVLKNMYTDDIRKAKNKIKVELTDQYKEEEDEPIQCNDDEYLESIKTWLLRLENDINNISTYNREKASLIYIKFIFDKVFIDGISVSELSREVGITYWSLRNTVLIIKDQIKNEVRG
jgi:DNA-directed RNA polymerase specialized sigma24 family protein